jgi:hypothetical protein
LDFIRQFYNSPIHSFLNFYPRIIQLNGRGYIFRTKLVNHYSGFATFINNQVNLPKRLVKIKNTKYVLKNACLEKLDRPINHNNYLLEVEKFKLISKDL